jgi:hypothetical protein
LLEAATGMLRQPKHGHQSADDLVVGGDHRLRGGQRLGRQRVVTTSTRHWEVRRRPV